MSFVDGEFGSDANDGSLKKPFATVEHAILVAKEYESIFLFTKDIKKSERVTGRRSFEIEYVEIAL